MTPRWTYAIGGVLVWAGEGCLVFLLAQEWGLWAFHAATTALAAYLWPRGEKAYPPIPALVALTTVRMGFWMRNAFPMQEGTVGMFALVGTAMLVLFVATGFLELTASRWIARNWLAKLASRMSHCPF